MPGGSANDITISQQQKGKQYDLLISDIRMPGLSGFELARKICALDSKIKIMLLTAYQMRKDEFDAAADIRIDTLINKPISMTRLNDLVAAVLQASAEDKLVAIKPSQKNEEEQN